MNAYGHSQGLKCLAPNGLHADGLFTPRLWPPMELQNQTAAGLGAELSLALAT